VTTDIDDIAFDPAESEIEFIARAGRNDSSVHVMVPLQDGDQVVGGVDLGFLATMSRARTLCGRVVAWHDYPGIEAFDDDRTRVPCRKAMGEHSTRLFEHPHPH
jgi:hypothetical protein